MIQLIKDILTVIKLQDKTTNGNLITRQTYERALFRLYKIKTVYNLLTIAGLIK